MDSNNTAQVECDCDGGGELCEHSWLNEIGYYRLDWTDGPIWNWGAAEGVLTNI